MSSFLQGEVGRSCRWGGIHGSNELLLCRVGRSSWLLMMALMSSFLQGGEVFMALMSSFLQGGEALHGNEHGSNALFLAGWGGLHGSNGSFLQGGEVFMALMSSFLNGG